MATPAQSTPSVNLDKFNVACKNGDVADFLLTVGMREIDFYADAFNQLDTKVGVLLGFSLVAVVQLIGLSIGNHLPKLGGSALNYLLIIGLALIFLATLAGIAARWPRDFEDGPAIQELMDEAKTVDRI